MSVMGLAEIFDRSFDILRKYIKTIVLYVLGFSILAFIAIIAFIILGSIVGVNLVSALISDGIVASTFLVLVIVLYFLFIAGFGLNFQVGIIKIASQDFLKEAIYADQAIKLSIKSVFKIIRIIIAAVILFIPILGIFTAIIYGIYPMISKVMNSGIQGGSEVIFIILLVIFLLVILMLVLAYITMLSFSLQVAVIEKKGAFSSIKRSYQLVRNNFWQIFGCIILFVLTIYAIYLSLQSFLAFILGLVYLIMTILNIQLDYLTFMAQIYSFTRWPFFLINWLVISPLCTIMITNLYYNQRFKVEGFDLILRLKELAEKVERKQASDSVKT